MAYVHQDRNVQTHCLFYSNSNFSCSFNGCKTWSVTLMEEHTLWVFENRQLRDDLWA